LKVCKLLILPMLALLLVWVGRIYAENNTEVHLSFQGVAINAEGNLLVKDNVKYVSLAFLTKQLRVTAVWKPDIGALRLKLGKNTYELHKDHLGYQTENNAKQLMTAPFEQAGQIWIPVDFLTELGVAARQDDQQSLVLDWTDNYLLAVEPITYQGRPAWALVGTKSFQVNSFLLREPERLVIDLTGFKAHPGLDTAVVQNQLVQQMRFSQFQADTLRLVWDLKQKCGYQIMTDPKNDHRLLLIFNYLVQTVNFSKQDGTERVQIKTDYPAVYTVTKLTRPNRAVIEFDGATLAAGIPLRVEGNGKCFERIRVSQYNPQTVRVVIDLANVNRLYQVIPSRKDPGIIEARTVQTVKTIECYESTPEITKLIITGTGELAETIRKLKKPARLQVDLDFFQFAPKLQIPLLNQLSQIKGAKLITVSPTVARIEVELNYLAGYEVKLSEDYQQLILTFIKSPLIGETLVLDAGHGGVDMGATGKHGIREKNINLEVTLRLKELLDEAGAKVVLTRNDDYFISLYERDFIANQLKTDLFVSIHTNFHPNPNVHGIEVYYYKGMADSALLAKKVETEMVKQTGLITLGVKNNDFVVIREALMPSILVELGYLSNATEEALINTAEFKDQAALGVFNGIIAYYNAKQAAPGK
jgi:N-acetylmuramoyl-L-alanine amidase